MVGLLLFHKGRKDEGGLNSGEGHGSFRTPHFIQRQVTPNPGVSGGHSSRSHPRNCSQFCKDRVCMSMGGWTERKEITWKSAYHRA